MQRSLYYTILILIILFILGCKSEQKREKNEFVIATLKGPSAISMIHMIDSVEKYQNKTLDFQIINEPMQVRKMMLEGEADMAVLPTTMAAILYNKGLNYQLAAIPVWGTLYLFGKDSTISTWQDLKGKRVYLMAKGMSPDVVFRYLLQKNGLEPEEDVILDYSFPTHIDLAQAVAANRAELAVISEPLVSLVMQKNPAVHSLLDLNAEWNKAHQDSILFAQTALLVSKDLAKNEHEWMNAFLDLYKHALQKVNRSPASYSSAIVEHGILPDTTIARSTIPRCNLHFREAWPIQKEITAYLNIFYEMNPEIIGGKLPDEAFFYKR